MTLDGKSVMEDSFNLTCLAGHRAFAPKDMAKRWAGGECGTIIGTDLRSKCREQLAYTPPKRKRVRS